MSALRERLNGALTQQFEQELALSLRHIREAMAPYTRFVRGEHDQLQHTEQELLAMQAVLHSLRARVQQL